MIQNNQKLFIPIPTGAPPVGFGLIPFSSCPRIPSEDPCINRNTYFVRIRLAYDNPLCLDCRGQGKNGSVENYSGEGAPRGMRRTK